MDRNYRGYEIKECLQLDETVKECDNCGKSLVERESCHKIIYYDKGLDSTEVEACLCSQECAEKYLRDLNEQAMDALC